MADVPRILTVDSSQGDESFMVFFDASAQFGDRVGKHVLLWKQVSHT
jgi:hypothetical protein